MNKKNKLYKLIYPILTIFIIFTLINKIITKDYYNVIFCLLSLLLFPFPYLLEKTFKINFSTHFKLAIILTIFFTQILGEVYKFYIIFPYWDNIIHMMTGFYFAAIAFNLLFLLNKPIDKINKIFIMIFTLSFSLSMGVIWELFEYSMDKLFDKDMQKDAIVDKISTSKLEDEKVIINNIDHTILYNKDNKELLKIDNGYLDIGINDTMIDFVFDLAGAILYSILTYLYLKDKKKYPLIETLTITKTT